MFDKETDILNIFFHMLYGFVSIIFCRPLYSIIRVACYISGIENSEWGKFKIFILNALNVPSHIEKRGSRNLLLIGGNKKSQMMPNQGCKLDDWTIRLFRF